MSFDRLNEIMATPIPPPLPAEQQASALDDESLLQRFFGPNAEHYLALWKKAEIVSPGSPSKMPSWNWPAALCFLPWAMYRKIWLFAGAIMLTSVVLQLVFPSAGSFLSLGFAAATGATANGVYLRHALKKITKLRATSPTDEDLLARLDRTGGVSKAGAWVGTIIMVFGTALAFVAAFNKH